MAYPHGFGFTFTHTHTFFIPIPKLPMCLWSVLYIHCTTPLYTIVITGRWHPHSVIESIVSFLRIWPCICTLRKFSVTSHLILIFGIVMTFSVYCIVVFHNFASLPRIWHCKMLLWFYIVHCIIFLSQDTFQHSFMTRNSCNNYFCLHQLFGVNFPFLSLSADEAAGITKYKHINSTTIFVRIWIWLCGNKVQTKFTAWSIIGRPLLHWFLKRSHSLSTHLWCSTSIYKLNSHGGNFIVSLLKHPASTTWMWYWYSSSI